MNGPMQNLWQTGAKESKIIIGLMSGTSLDGLDIALCRITGHGPTTKVAVQAFVTKTYPPEVVKKLRQVVSIKEVSLQQLCVMHAWLGNYHGELVLEALKKWQIAPETVDCIASHGQSVFHAPVSFHQQPDMPNSTLQIGDGDHIARKTGILTISDFRQKHTAAGGEGAPLAALTDALLFGDTQETRILLNIGGIANFTYLPKKDKKNSSVITTDTGPGNTLIDGVMKTFYDRPFDEDGRIAKQGTVQPGLLKQLLEHSFFSSSLPRTTGPELFNMEWVRSQQKACGTEELASEDLVATLTRLTAQTIADAIQKAVKDEEIAVCLSGGGMHNGQLVQWIEECLVQKVRSFKEIGFNPDAKEAACFAVLANETLSGGGFLVEGGENIHLGKISLPG